MNASAVPRGTPFPINASIIGTTLTEFAYKGEPNKTATGTAHQDLVDRYCSTKFDGTNPWIKAPMPTPKTTYGNTCFVIEKPSFHHKQAFFYR
jgi:hypothetical protein